MKRVLRLTDGYRYVPPPALEEIKTVGGQPPGGTRQGSESQPTQ
jgi:hypothetical protein